MDSTLVRLFGWARAAGHKLTELCHQAAGWATEAALAFVMLAYNLMSLFRQAVLRSRIQHTLSTLHGLVLAVGASWHRDASQHRLVLSVPRRKRDWLAGLWANASAPSRHPRTGCDGLMDNLGL
ncbi:MAG: hypothetical protein AB1768_00965 [Pseudomonadota bacterium]|jgi:hypothetical protein